MTRALGILVLVLASTLAACSASPPRSAVVTAPTVVRASTRVPLVPMVWVPKWGVHLVEGYDIVYYNQAYYFYYDRRWYVAASPAGPWALVATPPAALAALPPGGFHQRAGEAEAPPGR